LELKVEGVERKVEDVKAELRGDIEGVERKIEGVERKIEDVKAELRGDIEGVERKMRQEIQSVGRALAVIDNFHTDRALVGSLITHSLEMPSSAASSHYCTIADRVGLVMNHHAVSQELQELPGLKAAQQFRCDGIDVAVFGVCPMDMKHGILNISTIDKPAAGSRESASAMVPHDVPVISCGVMRYGAP
jgi:hypothetical protein